MGVHGLTGLLERNCRPAVRSLAIGEAKDRKDNVLLVDASHVEFDVLDKLAVQAGAGGEEDNYAAESKWLYDEMSRFYKSIQSTGLHCVLIMDTCPAPGHEGTWAERRRQRLQKPAPLAALIFRQAYADLGLEVVYSVHCADKLLLSWCVAAACCCWAGVYT